MRRRRFGPDSPIEQWWSADSPDTTFPGRMAMWRIVNFGSVNSITDGVHPDPWIFLSKAARASADRRLASDCATAGKATKGGRDLAPAELASRLSIDARCGRRSGPGGSPRSNRF